MKPILLALLLTGCSTGPICITDYGMGFMGYPDGTPPDVTWSCSRINDIESKMVDYMGDYKLLKGYSIYLHPVDSWTDDFGRRVGGYTACGTKQMHIGLGQEAIAHEIAHALQNCNAPLPIDDGMDIDHADWLRDRIYLQIEKVSR
jgi:hypothetical protein